MKIKNNTKGLHNQIQLIYRKMCLNGAEQIADLPACQGS